MLAGLRWPLIGVDGAEDGDCRGSLQRKLINSLFGVNNPSRCHGDQANLANPHCQGVAPPGNTLGKANGARGKAGMMASLSPCSFISS